MLRRIRQSVAILLFIAVTLLFLDFTGTAHAWLGWMAKIQFVPAVLALNVGVVVALLILTWVFGRVYCSVICPLGIVQDLFARLGRARKKNRYGYSPAKSLLRYVLLALYVVALVAGVGVAVAWLEPYSNFGMMANSLLAPLYGWGNNVLAYFAERADSYAFYETEVWMKSLPVLVMAVVILVVVAVLSWRNGRTYCNTICPVGTLLGFVARYSWLKPVIDTEKCVNCGLCAKNCKAACIDAKNHRIDYSRCVVCMNCLEHCSQKAIRYVHPSKKGAEAEKVSDGRRGFLAATAMLATAATVKAQEKKVDGGLAVIEDKKVPQRRTPIVPPGAKSLRSFRTHCVSCQLCVSACPNGVLRPSSDLMRLMQPEMEYERGYCRPECTKCSEVCPTGAIRPLTVADKSAVKIGTAVWVSGNCIALTDGVSCGNCARHCPTGAITMVHADSDDPDSPEVPAVNAERCIGCGACENLCPARPFSAIYVEGVEVHAEV